MFLTNLYLFRFTFSPCVVSTYKSILSYLYLSYLYLYPLIEAFRVTVR